MGKPEGCVSLGLASAYRENGRWVLTFSHAPGWFIDELTWVPPQNAGSKRVNDDEGERLEIDLKVPVPHDE